MCGTRVQHCWKAEGHGMRREVDREHTVNRDWHQWSSVNRVICIAAVDAPRQYKPCAIQCGSYTVVLYIRAYCAKEWVNMICATSWDMRVVTVLGQTQRHIAVHSIHMQIMTQPVDLRDVWCHISSSCIIVILPLSLHQSIAAWWLPFNISVPLAMILQCATYYTDHHRQLWVVCVQVYW